MTDPSAFRPRAYSLSNSYTHASSPRPTHHMTSSSSSLTLDSADPIQGNTYTHSNNNNNVLVRNGETADTIATNASNTLDDLLSQLDVETKIADGAQHLLQLFENDPQHNSSQALKDQVENELTAANDNIERLERLIHSVSIEQSLYTEDKDHDAPPHHAFSALGLDASPAPSVPDPLYPMDLPPQSSSSSLSSTDAGPLMMMPPSPVRSTPGLPSHSSPSHASTTDSPRRRLLQPHPPTPRRALTSDAPLSPSSLQQHASLPVRADGPSRPRRTDKADAESLRRQANAMLQALRDLILDGQTESVDRSPTAASSSSSSMQADISLPPERYSRSNHPRSRNKYSRLAVPPSPSSGRSTDLTSRKIELMDRLVAVLERNPRVRYEVDDDTLIEAAFPCLADSMTVEVRASAYRLLRHALTPQQSHALLSLWKHHGLDLYLTRSLLRDNRCALEKEQALKLFRAIVEVQYSSDPLFTPGPSMARSVDSPQRDEEHCLTEGMIRAVIATSENPEDKLRDVYIETLVELAIYNLPALLRASGMGAVLSFLLEGPPDLAPAITRTLIAIADQPTTRRYLRPRLDLETALAGFTDLPAQKGFAYVESLQTTAKIITILLSSWTGILYLSMNDHAALRSLVTALRVGPEDVQESILGVLTRVFDAGLGADASNQRDKTKHSSDLPEVDVAEGKMPQSRTAVELRRKARERKRQRIGLVDQYLSLLLVLFIDCGLCSALIHIFETSPKTSRSATLLMGSLLQIGNRVLPQSYNAHFHQLPELFRSASSFNDPTTRQKAVAALSAIDRTTLELQNDARSSRKTASTRQRADSTADDPLLRGHRQVEKVKLMMSVNMMDDNAFRMLLLETQIQSTRDHTKWNVEKILDLLQGPLLNIKRLEEALRLTKLIRRLLSFFHPSERRFSELPATPPNRVWIRLACTLLSTLLICPDGVKFIAEDKLLREVKDAFDQIDTSVGILVEDPVLAKSRITSTLSQGYFDIIGTLSASTEGTKLLNRFGLWTSLYKICQQGARDDLVKVMLEKLDYSIDGHPRILLGWTLSSGSRPMRRFATEHLTRLIRSCQLPAEWMISALLTQLCDPAESIRGIAVAVVKEVCSSPDALEMVVSMRPTLDHLGETGHELLLRFLSIPGGLRYLLEGDYIDHEMEEWFNVRNHRYAVQMEVNLSRALSIHRKRDNPDLDAEPFGPAPPHFYGELAKTAEGCQVLRQKGHFLEFAHFIRHHGMEGGDLEVLSKLKSVLWTVGNIGSTTGGFPFLESNGTIANIVDVAENSPVLSVRGVCFYVIGLISLTRQGAEILQDYGWQSACTTFGKPIGICIPHNLRRFCELPTWTPTTVKSSREYSRLPPLRNQLQNSILNAIANLGNSILANKASRTLTKLKQSHPAPFASMPLFVHAMALMDGYRLRQVVRRFIFDLFEIELNPRTMKQIRRVREQLLKEQRAGAGGSDVSRGYATTSSSLYPGGGDLSGTTFGVSSSSGPGTSVHKRRSRIDPLNPLEDAAFEDADMMDEEDDIDEDDEEEDAYDYVTEDTLPRRRRGFSTTMETDLGASVLSDGDDDRTGVSSTTDIFSDAGGGRGSKALFLGQGKSRSTTPFDMRRAHSAQSGLSVATAVDAGTVGGGGGAKSLRFDNETTRDSTTTMTSSTSFFSRSTAAQEPVFIDGFGERKGANWTEPPKEAPAPGVRIIGGFGEVPPSNSGSLEPRVGRGGHLRNSTTSLFSLSRVG